MKTLTLIRHAKSSWSDPGSTDHQRTLNSRGKSDAPEMGKRLAKLLTPPQTVFCSDATRAQETAHLFLPALGVPVSMIQLAPDIYEAATGSLLDVIATAPEDNDSLMLLGHNPGMERLCNLIVPGAVPGMVTCAVSSFAIDTNSWHDITGKPSKLIMHDFPKNR